MIGSLLPLPRFTGWSDVGDPIPGGFLDTFASGTTTPQPTYTNAARTVANANPIVLDAAGRAVVFLTPGIAYTIRLRTAAGVTVWSQDDVGMGATDTTLPALAGETLPAFKAVYLSDGSGGKTAGSWYLAGRGIGTVAASYSTTTPLLGMTTNVIANGTVGAVTVSGTVAGLAGLVAGSLYYLNTAIGLDGTITNVAPIPTHTGNGDNELPRVVGLATSATTLMLFADPPPVTVRMPIVHVHSNNFETVLELPAGCDILILEQAFAGSTNIAGLSAGKHEQELLIIQATAGRQTNLQHQAAGAPATQRLLLPVTSADMPIAPNGFARLRYDASVGRWLLTNHDQGDWITASPAAGDFTAGGTMAWGVTIATDLIVCRYRLRMNNLDFVLNITQSSITAPLNPQVSIGKACYGGFNLADAATLTGAAAVNDNAAGVIAGAYLQTTVAGVKLTLGKWTVNNFVASVNLTDVYVDTTFRVA